MCFYNSFFNACMLYSGLEISSVHQKNPATAIPKREDGEREKLHAGRGAEVRKQRQISH